MSNDFRSLLGTFQAATTVPREDSDKQKTKSTSSGSKKQQSVKELLNRLWRSTQIRSSLSSRKRGAPASVTTAAAEERNATHVGVCLCIIDQLPNEAIWEYWLEQDKLSRLYIHAKHPSQVTSPFVKKHLIDQSFQPNWNDVRVVQALLALMERALKQDGQESTHILLGTESCLPVSLTTQIQLDKDKSYMSLSNNPSRFEERSIWSVLEAEGLPTQAIYKALPGWCVLCRDHAKAILELPDQHLHGQALWPLFRHCWAPEEVYFGTCLALLGKVGQDAIRRSSLVFAEWNHRARNEHDRAHPKEFGRSQVLDQSFWEALDSTLPSGWLILRKVKEQISIQEWLQHVIHRSTRKPMEPIADDASKDLKKHKSK